MGTKRAIQPAQTPEPTDTWNLFKLNSSETAKVHIAVGATWAGRVLCGSTKSEPLPVVSVPVGQIDQVTCNLCLTKAGKLAAADKPATGTAPAAATV